jgi:hypothetical protein
MRCGRHPYHGSSCGWGRDPSRRLIHFNLDIGIDMSDTVDMPQLFWCLWLATASREVGMQCTCKCWPCCSGHNCHGTSRNILMLVDMLVWQLARVVDGLFGNVTKCSSSCPMVRARYLRKVVNKQLQCAQPTTSYLRMLCLRQSAHNQYGIKLGMPCASTATPVVRLGSPVPRLGSLLRRQWHRRARRAVDLVGTG